MLLREYRPVQGPRSAVLTSLLYSRVLSATEVAEHYAARLEPAGDAYRLFNGYVQRWPQQYRADGKDALVTVEAFDGFMVLALAELNTTYVQQQSGVRIGAVLDSIGWPAADRAIDSGQTAIQAVTLTGTKALDHLQAVAQAENGRLFMDGAGKVTFLERHSIYRAPYSVSQGTFGDSTGELPYRNIEIAYDDTQIWNDVRVTRVGGVEQTANDATSQSRYFVRTLRRTGLLISDDNEVDDAATWLKDRYKDPVLRATSLVLAPQRVDTLWPYVLGTDFGERITVNRRPPGGGTISFDNTIEGISHDIQPKKVWGTGWKLGRTDTALTTPFILDQSKLEVSAPPDIDYLVY
jgi:hypothetical protein